jgi:hypothetical protein
MYVYRAVGHYSIAEIRFSADQLDGARSGRSRGVSWTSFYMTDLLRKSDSYLKSSHNIICISSLRRFRNYLFKRTQKNKKIVSCSLWKSVLFSLGLDIFKIAGLKVMVLHAFRQPYARLNLIHTNLYYPGS